MAAPASSLVWPLSANDFSLTVLQEGRRELLYKVLVVGDIGTGKTSIIKRYVHGIFTQHYKSTIGVDFALKARAFAQSASCNHSGRYFNGMDRRPFAYNCGHAFLGLLHLIAQDIAGQERFGNMTRVYYKEAVGALVVFDV